MQRPSRSKFGNNASELQPVPWPFRQEQASDKGSLVHRALDVCSRDAATSVVATWSRACPWLRSWATSPTGPTPRPCGCRRHVKLTPYRHPKTDPPPGSTTTGARTRTLAGCEPGNRKGDQRGGPATEECEGARCLDARVPTGAWGPATSSHQVSGPRRHRVRTDAPERRTRPTRHVRAARGVPERRPAYGRTRRPDRRFGAGSRQLQRRSSGRLAVHAATRATTSARSATSRPSHLASAP